jgi:hypothetical protein
VIEVRPAAVGQVEGIVRVAIAPAEEMVTDWAQWTSRRRRSSPRRASVCAWKRRFMSTSELVALTSRTLTEVMMLPRIDIETRSSIRE